MKGIELLPLIKATSKADRYSENLMKWVRKYKNRELIVAIATEGKRVFDSAKTQSSHLYIGYTPIEDGYLMGSRLSEILCNGAKTSTWVFHGLKFVEVPDWWQRYIEGAKCCIDPEHWLYANRERWEVAEDGKTRRCLWCGKHTQYLKTEMVPKASWHPVTDSI